MKTYTPAEAILTALVSEKDFDMVLDDYKRVFWTDSEGVWDLATAHAHRLHFRSTLAALQARATSDYFTCYTNFIMALTTLAADEIRCRIKQEKT